MERPHLIDNDISAQDKYVKFQSLKAPSKLSCWADAEETPAPLSTAIHQEQTSESRLYLQHPIYHLNVYFCV